jgi:nucleotide-binding universal stress UspA family protein
LSAMKTIIIPTDFSANARKAAVFAYELFGAESTYILLNAYEIPASTHSTMFMSLEEELKKDAIRELENEKKELLALSDTEIKLGVIDSAVSDYKANFIVMGTHGATGLKNVFLGSNSYDLVTSTNCPVIVVPEKTKFAGANKISFAADLQRIDENVVLRPIIDLVTSSEADLELIHIDTERNSESIEEHIERLKLDRYFEAVPHTFRSELYDNIFDGLKGYVAKNGVDMLVLLARPKGILETLFLQSTSRDMVMTLGVPIMVLHDSAAS